jgi:Holliday junction resolvase RusA-like endonuclease
VPKLVISLPPAKLRVNAKKGAWQKAYAVATKYRETVGNEALVQQDQWKGRQVEYPVRVDVWVCITGNRKADVFDALTWCKELVDELVKIGVWTDDSDQYCNPIMVGIERVQKFPRVEFYWRDAAGKV